MRPVFHWNIGLRTLELGRRTLVHGVGNGTPDCFADGGMYLDHDQAVKHGLQLLNEGADSIDVGGESTRPGARVLADSSEKKGDLSSARMVPRVRTAVTEKEELDRVIPVITTLKQKRPEAVISVDTYKTTVARAAVEA